MGDVLSRLRSALAGRYTLERELGRGGMATVWLVQDLRHDRPVALKVLRPELAAALGPERFLREVRITARLNHPHVLPLLDSGEADGFLFYVMPYVAGESLRDRLDREKQLPLDDALQIAREVADALSYAHTHDVVHRDVKPENILLESGHAVVADFGIARAISAAGGEALTQTGIAVGTPAYMSPEQAAGSRELDGRSDLYSLGCVLYEMLAGRAPFVGPTVESIVHQHLTTEPPSIASLRPAVPAGVVAALTRALSKTPADRFNPVALFGEAILPRLSAATALQPSVPVEVGIPWRRWGLIGAVVAIVVVSTVALTRWARRDAVLPRHPRTAIAVLPFQNLSAEGPHAYFAGGLHDELLTQLARVAALKVISRTSVMGYGGVNTPPLRQIARELGVGSVVEGSVQVVGGRLQVNVQLIDAATDAHLWAERYNRMLDDAFAIQSDIARQIVAAVGATLSAAEREALAATPTADAEVYRLYLEGMHAWNTRTESGYRKAAALFREAIARDSGFARGYLGLASALAYLSDWSYVPLAEAHPGAWAALERALALDSTLADAHTLRGLLFGNEGKISAAGDAFVTALTIDPKSPFAHHLYAYHLVDRGEPNRALDHIRQALALEPLSLPIMRSVGRMYVFNRQYDSAAVYFRRALAIEPTFPVRMELGEVYLWTGKLVEARREIEAAASTLANVQGSLCQLYARLADSVSFRRALSESIRNADAPELALCYLAMDDRVRALDALDARETVRPLILESPFFDPLRTAPRFRALLDRSRAR